MKRGKTLIEFHGSGCPKCGGTVGPHSDYCLDCGYDAAGGLWAPIIMGILIGTLFATLAVIEQCY